MGKLPSLSQFHPRSPTVAPSWTIALAADEAGHSYKAALKADLEKDPRVKAVIDCGVNADTDKTAYPHVAVAAARKVASGEADRALMVCGTGELSVWEDWAWSRGQ